MFLIILFFIFYVIIIKILTRVYSHLNLGYLYLYTVVSFNFVPNTKFLYLKAYQSNTPTFIFITTY